MVHVDHPPTPYDFLLGIPAVATAGFSSGCAPAGSGAFLETQTERLCQFWQVGSEDVIATADEHDHWQLTIGLLVVESSVGGRGIWVVDYFPEFLRDMGKADHIRRPGQTGFHGLLLQKKRQQKTR